MIALLAPGSLAPRVACEAACEAGRAAVRYAVTETGVGVVSVRGAMGELGIGSVPYAAVAAALDAALEDRRARACVLELDTPGGSVAHLTDALASARRLAAAKPLVALAHDQADSAGYWLATAAPLVLATPTAGVGCIGAAMVLEDSSQMAEGMGVRAVSLTDAPAKLAGVFGVAQDERIVGGAAREVMAYSAMFRRDVARARGLSEDDVLALDGATLPGEDAMAAGLVDGIVDDPQRWLLELEAA